MLAVLYVIAMFLIVKPVVDALYRHFQMKGDVADSSLFSWLLILMLLLSAFTAEVIGLFLLILSAIQSEVTLDSRHPCFLRLLTNQS